MSDNALLGGDGLVGKVLQGNYKIGELIGKGGMAYVYKANHTKLDEPMAVKILLPHIAEDEDVRGRFLDEAKIQFKLKHPNIVQVTDVIEEGSTVGIVMEWVQGMDLKQVIQAAKKPLSNRDVWRVMAPVLEAVGYAHQRGLVHRDIKPANILVHQEGKLIVPKIADFGIAKILDEFEEGKTATGMAMGTVKFMPPEQLRDSKNVDQRADVYALGVTVYNMVTGHFPFEGRNEWVMYQKMTEDPPPPSTHNPALSSTFDQMMLRCLARDPDDRYQNCQEFAYELSIALVVNNDLPDIPDNPTDIYNRLMSLPSDNDFYSEIESTLPPTVVGSTTSSSTLTAITKGNTGVGVSPVKNKKPKPPPGYPGSSKEPDIGSDETVYPGMLQTPTGGGGSKKGLWIAMILFLGLAAGGGAFYFLAGPGSAPTPTVRRTPPVGRRLRTPPERRVKKVTCVNDATRPCYTGDSATKGKGGCKAGKQTCAGGKWGKCEGAILPTAERCNGKDDNCDGQVDNAPAFAKKGKSCGTRYGACTLQGTWACSKDNKSLRCAPDSKAKSNNVTLRISPRGRTFSLYASGKKWSVRSSFCVPYKYRMRVRVKSRGYFPCSFRIKRRKSVLRLKMKRDDNGLQPPLSYCVR